MKLGKEEEEALARALAESAGEGEIIYTYSEDEHDE